jgi:hypothetical protein
MGNERNERFDFALSAEQRAKLERISTTQDRSAGAVLRTLIAAVAVATQRASTWPETSG